MRSSQTLLKVGLDLSQLMFPSRSASLFKQVIDSRLAGSECTQVHIGFRVAQRLGKTLIKSSVSLGGGEFGVKCRAVLLLGVGHDVLGEAEQVEHDEQLDHTLALTKAGTGERPPAL